MRAILVALCLLMTAMAFAPEAAARPCVLEMGTNPNVCGYNSGSLGDDFQSCAHVLTGTMPNLAPLVCVSDNDNGVFVCHYSQFLLWSDCYHILR